MKMFGKFLIVALSVFVSNSLAADYCYNDVVSACSPVGSELSNCNAKYGAVGEVQKELQNMANNNIGRNWQFLLMSSHFKNYEKNREGFAKLYKKYSDKAWEDGIKLIKYVTKRGGIMDFKYKKQNIADAAIENYELSEIHSIGKALDIWKNLAIDVHHVHGEITRRRENFHDTEVGSFLENEFVHGHSEIIRDVAGHANDLKRLLNDNTDSSLALFLFDNYLSKTV